jgi:hypothetical protein
MGGARVASEDLHQSSVDSASDATPDDDDEYEYDESFYDDVSAFDETESQANPVAVIGEGVQARLEYDRECTRRGMAFVAVLCGLHFLAMVTSRTLDTPAKTPVGPCSAKQLEWLTMMMWVSAGIAVTLAALGSSTAETDKLAVRVEAGGVALANVLLMAIVGFDSLRSVYGETALEMYNIFVPLGIELVRWAGEEHARRELVRRSQPMRRRRMLGRGRAKKKHARANPGPAPDVTRDDDRPTACATPFVEEDPETQIASLRATASPPPERRSKRLEVPPDITRIQSNAEAMAFLHKYMERNHNEELLDFLVRVNVFIPTAEGLDYDDLQEISERYIEPEGAQSLVLSTEARLAVVRGMTALASDFTKHDQAVLATRDGPFQLAVNEVTVQVQNDVLPGFLQSQEYQQYLEGKSVPSVRVRDEKKPAWFRALGGAVPMFRYIRRDLEKLQRRAARLTERSAPRASGTSLIARMRDKSGRRTEEQGPVTVDFTGGDLDGNDHNNNCDT